MAREGIWVIDPTTNEREFVYYDELEEETKAQVFRPVGGFCYKADEFVQLPLPSAPFYIEDWLPKRGKSMIYAPAKSGKSFLCLQMARCIGQGLDFLGQRTTRARVLYLQFELGVQTLQARMNNVGLPYENVYVGTTYSMKLDGKGGQDQLWRALESILPNVLILDPFYKVIAGDENESKDVRVILEYLDKIIEGFGEVDCSILIIHHTGKDTKRGSRGSSVLEDWVDSYIQMKKTSKNGEPLAIELMPKLLRHAESPPEGVAAILTEGYEFKVESAEPTVEDLVLTFITTAGESVSPRQILAAGVGSNASVYDALKILTTRGQIKKEGRGLYNAML